MNKTLIIMFQLSMMIIFALITFGYHLLNNGSKYITTTERAIGLLIGFIFAFIVSIIVLIYCYYKLVIDVKDPLIKIDNKSNLQNIGYLTVVEILVIFILVMSLIALSNKELQDKRQILITSVGVYSLILCSLIGINIAYINKISNTEDDKTTTQ